MALEDGWSQDSHVQILERGPHHRVERALKMPGQAETLPPDIPQPLEGSRASTYTVIETGMNYFSEEEGIWKPSEEVIEIIDGAGVARRGQQKVIFSPNLNTEGSIDLQTPDGKRLRATTLALGYFDALSGTAVTLGMVKDSIGTMVAPNQILYEDAFDNIQADVLYTYRKSGLEQDIILRERPPAPDFFGLENLTTRLEVMTEFFNPPQPGKRERVLRRVEDPELRGAMVEPDFIDEELDFGEVRIGHGRAFYVEDALGDRPDLHEDAVLVGKRWFQRDGRTLLLEAVEYEAIQPHIQDLAEAPRHQAWLDQKEKNESMLAELQLHRNGQRSLPKKLFASVETDEEKPLLLAQTAVERRPGFVLDYVTMSDQSGFTFHGDTTYYVDGSVHLTGTTTLEGGSVIKHRPFSYDLQIAPRLFIEGPLVCKTSPYRPAIITAKDDDTVGATISGSDGDPSDSNKFAYYGIYFYFSGSNVTLEHVRVSYAKFGVLFNDSLGYTHTLRHAQLVDCTWPIYSQKGTSGNNTVLKVQNVLVDKASRAFYTWHCDVAGEHLTVNNATDLYHNVGGSTYSLKNSLLANVGTIQSYTRDSEIDNINNPTGSIFQMIGAGDFYLANASPYRDAGITSIDAELLADLGTRTTYPPIELTGTANTDVILSPVAGRDTDIPDIGYHYPAVDYALETYTFAGTDLTITPGTALISVDDTGLWIQDGSLLKCKGMAEAPIHFAPYYLVQEQSENLYAGALSSATLINPYSTGTAPDALIEFTHFHGAANGGYNLYGHSSGGWRYANLTVRHSEFHGGTANLNGQSGNTYTLFNNLFHKVPVSFSGYHQVGAKNNLFFNLDLTLLNLGSAGNWTFHYNVFDHSLINENFPATVNGYNGYVGASPDQLSSSSGGDVLVSTFNYGSGAFGDFYHDSLDFRNVTTVTATSLGFAHFTARTTSHDSGYVDLGYHLPLIEDTTGIPTDRDEDGLPNYMEDTDGDFLYDQGLETDWGNDDTDGDALSDFAEVVGGNFGQADYVNLPALGADPLHIDIFIEADYYVNVGSGNVSLEPYAASLDAVEEAFANAPVANSDNTTGINVHFLIDDAIDTEATSPHSQGDLDLHPNRYAEFLALRSVYFTDGREDYFHWALFADSHSNGGSSGFSLGAPGDSFTVTLGPAYWSGWRGLAIVRNVQTESGTIMHELGHNLGLYHGGRADPVIVPDYTEAYKPNYFSIMSYTYQLSGLRVDGIDGVIDFSRIEVAAVSENALYETFGFAPAGATTEADLERYGVYVMGEIILSDGYWIDNGTDGASANLDFNHNGSIQSGWLNPATNDTDLNRNNTEDDSFHPPRIDWMNLVYSGGQIGEGFEALSSPATIECTTGE